MSRLSRFTNLWRSRALDAELDAELQFHLHMRIEANLRAGMTRADAEREARRHLGGALRHREGMREARVYMSLDTLVRDVAYGARQFRRQPGSVLLVLLALSLGIGANAVIFSLLHAALLRPLPFREPDRLVAIVDNERADNRTNLSPTVPELLDLRAATRTLGGISFFDVRDVQIVGGTEPARAVAARVEASFLSTLGAVPQLGRLFVDGENAPGRDHVVIFSDAFWRRAFAADSGVIGRSMIVNGEPSTVVGVLPADFAFDYFGGDPMELFVPFSMSPDYTSRAAPFVNVRRVTAIARLRPGVTIERASAEVEAIGRGIAAEHPELYRRGSDGQEVGFAMGIAPLRALVAGSTRKTVWLLFGAVALVLVIACANTAQFLLARALERRQEVSIRIALGASRGRLVRQFLTEASLLAAAAAVAGLLLAMWSMGPFRAMVAPRAALLAGVEVNGSVVGFAAAVGAVVTLACGLLPAIHFSRRIAASAGGGSVWTIGVVRARTRQVLTGIEVAVSIVLFLCAGLLVQGMRELRDAPRGYSSEDVTVARLRMAGPPVAGGSGALYRRYLERLSAVPGVAGAAIADGVVQGYGGIEFGIVGRARDGATLAQQRASWRIVSPDYFSVLRIPLVAGRAFTDGDDLDRTRVAIINAEMARRFWPNASPLGQQIQSGAGPRASVMTVVGVVGDVRPVLRQSVEPQIYVSYLQQSEPNGVLLVRSVPGRTVPIADIKRAIWSVLPEQPLFDVRPMAAVVDQALTQPRTVARLLGALALLAVLMSAMGVYTIVAYLTERRTKEIALRRAIGAEASDVVRLLAGRTMLSASIGILVGIAGTVVAAKLLRAVVLNSARLDVTTAVWVALVYIAVVAIAVAVPAWRALRIEPAGVLRAD
jgi:putative ABC transport system permease protein